jgi:hypothetical protein|nr:MAG TPA: hypothetical protein [Caudoviricetes sp.]
MKKYYYVVSISCNVRNSKEKMLREYLSGFKGLLVETDEEYTLDIFLADLRHRLNKINALNRRSRDIHLAIKEGMEGRMTIVFESIISNDYPSAIMTLSPVRRWVAGSSSNGKSDAE